MTYAIVVSDERYYPSREFQVPIQPRARVETVRKRPKSWGARGLEAGRVQMAADHGWGDATLRRTIGGADRRTGLDTRACATRAAATGDAMSAQEVASLIL
jgi:hypothetical protein